MYYYHTRPTWRHWVGWYYHPGSRRRQAAASPWSLNIQYIVKTKISTLQPPVQRNGSLPSWRWTSSSLKNDLKFYCELSALPSDLLLPGDYAQVGPAQGHLGDDPTEKLQDSLGDKGPHWSRPQVNWTNLVWCNIIVKLALSCGLCDCTWGPGMINGPFRIIPEKYPGCLSTARTAIIPPMLCPIR